MVTLGNAASHLKIQSLIVEGSTRDKLADDRFPFRVGVRVHQSDAVEAALQASEMLSQAIGLPVVDGDHFIYAVAINEPPIDYGNFPASTPHKAPLQIYRHKEC